MQKLFCLIPALILISCSGSKQSSASLEQKQVPQLFSENNLFIADSVKFYADKASKDQVTRAKLLFYQGLDKYLNQTNPVEGIKLFTQSALLNPTGKTYYYLANAIIDKGDTTNVTKALGISSLLEYEEQDEITYTYARMYAVLGDTSATLEELAVAFSQGFINKKRIETDKCFDKIRNLMPFEAMMISNFKDEVALKAKVFKSFLAEFPEASLPLEIHKDSMGNVNGNFINYDYSSFIIGMEDGRFSRDVTNEYLMVARFKTTKNVNAVIYKTITAIVDTLQPAEIKIATYDSSGTVLAELTIGEFAVPTTLTLGSIDTSGVISVRHYTMKWKSDPMEKGYTGNERLADEFTAENKFIIDENGKFIPFTRPEETKQ
ncbi:MAG: hypothetical protein ACXVPN_14335 [Bacteroidia bacterium]